MSAQRVNIRPGVAILSLLRHVNYKPWYAISEFVDNSLQSYLSNAKALRRVDGRGYKLQVAVELDTSDDGRLVVRDNAAGIAAQDFPRAFRPAEIPPDRSGLSEFGMGMKSAACWFARSWSVRTSALGEGLERTVEFDIETIVHDDIQELTVRSRRAPADVHYTEIVLTGLHKPPQTRTIAKIKDHLASIYRIFIREGILELRFNDEVLVDPKVDILTAPYFKEPKGKPIEWRRTSSFDVLAA